MADGEALTDDGVVRMNGRSVSILLTPGPDGQERLVALPRPSMGQMATIFELAAQADEALPKPAPPPANVDGMSEAELVAYTTSVQEVLRERRIAQFRPSSPHGLAMIEMINLLAGASYTADDMDLAVMIPRTMKRVLDHWEAPLGGAAPAVVLPPPVVDGSDASDAAPSTPTPSLPDPPAPASPDATPGSLPGTDSSGQPSPVT